MSESSLESLPVDEPIDGVFVVYDYLHVPVTGLTQSDFTIYLSHNGAISSEAVTISEVGNGRYLYTFTPNEIGEWYILIIHSVYNPRGWDDEFIAEEQGERVATGSTWPYSKDYLRRTREQYERRDRMMRKRKTLNTAALLAILLAAEDDA
jgi:hypothetical protein